MKTEDIEMRFGVTAVKKGFATPDQIIKALEIQVKEDLSTGRHRRIGSILLEQGLISRPQMDEVARELARNQ